MLKWVFKLCVINYECIHLWSAIWEASHVHNFMFLGLGACSYLFTVFPQPALFIRVEAPEGSRNGLLINCCRFTMGSKSMLVSNSSQVFIWSKSHHDWLKFLTLINLFHLRLAPTWCNTNWAFIKQAGMRKSIMASHFTYAAKQIKIHFATLVIHTTSSLLFLLHLHTHTFFTVDKVG